MILSLNEGHFFISLDSMATLAVAMLLYFFGMWICRKIPWFQQYCIPPAIVGGTVFALFNLINHQFNFGTLIFDDSLQIPAMAGFFACTGLGVAKGGVHRSVRGMGVYFGLCVFLVLCQNILAVGLAFMFGIEPALGLLAGSTSMVGGHGTAISFGQTLVQQGIPNAAQVGTAAATFGLVAGSALGGPLAAFILHRQHISTPNKGHRRSSSRAAKPEEHTLRISPQSVYKHVSLVAVVMGSSSLFAAFIQYIIPSLFIPASVAAMVVGLLVGYSLKRWRWMSFDGATLDLISELMLLVFLTESSMSLQLWELFDLALPLMTILVAQVTFIALYSYFVVHPTMSKAMQNNYEATIMIAALCGHGLGATPNAMANMDAVTDRFGPAPNAYLIVPLAGGFMIDVVNVPLVFMLLNQLI